MLPLPRFATRSWFLVFLAFLHVYMGSGHVLSVFENPISWTDTWKGFGAILGAYYFIAIAARARATTADTTRPSRDPRQVADGSA